MMYSKRAMNTLQLVAVSVAAGLGAIAISTAPSLAQSNAAPYQEQAPHPVSIPDQFEETFFNADKDFMTNRGLGRQLGWIFGLGHPENEANSDARGIHELYREVLHQQSSADPIVRTQDLPNPYNSSFFELQRTGGLEPNTNSIPSLPR